MDFSDILADANTFPDTAEITIGDQKISLGQIRDLSKKQQASITERMNALDKERNEVKELAVKAADLLAKAQPLADGATRKVEPKQETTEDYWDTDPLYEPIRKRLSPIEKQLKDAMDTITAQKTALEKAALIFARDRWDRQYESGKIRLKGDKYKDYRSVDKLAEYAAQHQLVDAFGMPSVERAIVELTKPDELEELKRQAKEEGIEEGRRMARLNTMARPTSSSGKSAGQKPSKGLDPTKNFEDLGDAVAEDADLMEALAKVSGLDLNGESVQ